MEMSYYSYILCQELKKLGSDLKNARKRRNIKTALMAEKMGVTRATLDRMEKGEPTVSIGVYLTAIYTLDPRKLKEFTSLFSREKDIWAKNTLDSVDSDLPKRIRGWPKI
jgi:transcriptional regulator with XRE-family HTH domain